MSVATPCPEAVRPPSRSITVTDSEGIVSPGHRSHVVLTQFRVGPVAVWIALKIESTGPSPLASPTCVLTGRHLDGDPGLRLTLGTGFDLEPAQLMRLLAFAHLVGDDRLQVECGDLLLLVGDLLETLESLIQRVAVDEKPSCSRASFSACRPECLPRTIWFESRPTSVASMISKVERSFRTPS